VEVLVYGVAAIMAAADRHGFNGPGAFHPGELVDLVDVVVAEDAAAGPEEGVEETDLMHELGNAFRFDRGGAAAGAHAVAAHGYNLTDLAVADTAEQLLTRAAMAHHQAHAYFQVFPAGFFAERD